MTSDHCNHCHGYWICGCGQGRKEAGRRYHSSRLSVPYHTADHPRKTNAGHDILHDTPTYPSYDRTRPADIIGINPLSIPGSSLTSPSPDPNAYYPSHRFASVSPSETGPLSLSNPSLSYPTGNGNGNGAGSHSASHTAPSSSHGLSRLEIDAAASGAASALGQGGQGPASSGAAAGPSSASYNQNRFAFNLNPTDPTFRALYSASPDHFAFNMGYSQSSPSTGITQAQAQAQAQRTAQQGAANGSSNGNGGHQTSASSVAGPSRTGSSGSITGLGGMTSMQGVERGIDITSLLSRTNTPHGQGHSQGSAGNGRSQQQHLTGYPDPSSYLDNLDLDLEDDKLKVVQMPMSAMGSMGLMGDTGTASSTSHSGYGQIHRTSHNQAQAQGRDPLSGVDMDMHGINGLSSQRLGEMRGIEGGEGHEQGEDERDHEQGQSLGRGDGADDGDAVDGEDGEQEDQEGQNQDEDGEVDNEEPLYVNAKQYHRILKRRMARARLEELNRLSRSRKVSIIVHFDSW